MQVSLDIPNHVLQQQSLVNIEFICKKIYRTIGSVFQKRHYFKGRKLKIKEDKTVFLSNVPLFQREEPTFYRMNSSH